MYKLHQKLGQKLYKKLNIQVLALGSIPILLGFWVWLSSLAFVPVPWPDDSAFYFVARELFQWPPRWVMLPQAPFEPTYRIFNFNTMPLYPILIGLGRIIGIDGSFLLKIWPLSAWALSGSLWVTVLYRKGLPFIFCALLALAFGLDPELRWASVLVRPESLIGLFGMALILGLTFGFPKRFEPRKLWDPVAALLALGAYCHFNAIHLLPAVLITFIWNPKRLMQIGAKTVLYLSPWLLFVVYHWQLFLTQMETQWSRLAVPNSWLNTPTDAINSIFQAMGSPTPWEPTIRWAAAAIWIIFLATAIFFVILPVILSGLSSLSSLSRLNSIKKQAEKNTPLFNFRILPAFTWVLGAIWLFQTKPEVWFVYFFHAAMWCLVGILFLNIWLSLQSHLLTPGGETPPKWKKAALISLNSLVTVITGIFFYVDVSQAIELGNQESWHWDTYHDFVSCVDDRLSQLEAHLGPDKPFHVWCPTFPDITIELSRKHPHWELTRTNDFWSRNHLAIQHAWNTEAVVITETLGHEDRTVSDKAENVPEIQSIWMHWKEYYLNQLWISPGWKPNRYICQRGKWQAFIFMKDEPLGK